MSLTLRVSKEQFLPLKSQKIGNHRILKRPVACLRCESFFPRKRRHHILPLQRFVHSSA